MVFRIRTYHIKPTKLKEFNDFFHEYLLPNQIRFGAALIGRWVNKEKSTIIAIWRYESISHYHQIEEQIKSSKLHTQAQNRKKELDPLYISTTQEFWNATGDYEGVRA
ncbi:NIPSNAP family protein [Rossellomorea aquimaris]|uniref:NIPSNAP family protein n=1 Tax=Rossellomorea aquimaris TaxID=189382 RepID=UPI0007D07E99|nr:NIPSNAP family protein [Rossellomorea aquimaris]